MKENIRSRYDGLLEKIANEFHILQGSKEQEVDWASRVIYSLSARMGYASLWDIQEDGEPASVIHFKKRMMSVAVSCLKMYPECLIRFPEMVENRELGEENQSYNGWQDFLQDIESVYELTGCFYHRPQRVVPAMPKAARLGDVILTRGFSIDMPQMVSGAGTYLDGEVKITPNEMVSPNEMFQVPEESLPVFWRRLLQGRVWKALPDISDMEFLRVTPPYRKGYWQEQPDKSGEISLVRISESGTRIYYLYYVESGTLKISQLPAWMVEGHRYRNISNACLFAWGTLPASHYEIDGDRVLLYMGYLYPPAEFNLVKLYSWPLQYQVLPGEGIRVFDRRIFFAVKSLLERRGYTFVEE